MMFLLKPPFPRDFPASHVTDFPPEATPKLPDPPSPSEVLGDPGTGRAGTTEPMGFREFSIRENNMEFPWNGRRLMGKSQIKSCIICIYIYI